MITRASGLGMGVGRFSRPVRGVGVIAMPNAGWIQPDALRSLQVLVSYHCLEPAWQLEYILTVAV
jgi:hypothetical protein